MKEIMLTLPFPPSTNTYWRRAGNHIHISNKGRQYRQDVIAIVGREQFGTFEDARVRVTMQLIPPDRRRRDVDNYAKGLFDALTHAGVWNDDEQIDILSIYKRDPIPNEGCVVVTIREIEK
jgi:crossover junction endodeoxyribonuclease RusA